MPKRLFVERTFKGFGSIVGNNAAGDVRGGVAIELQDTGIKEIYQIAASVAPQALAYLGGPIEARLLVIDGVTVDQDITVTDDIKIQGLPGGQVVWDVKVALPATGTLIQFEFPTVPLSLNLGKGVVAIIWQAATPYECRLSVNGCLRA